MNNNNNNNNNKRAVILGAGISGLIVAEKLSSKKFIVDVVEKKNMVGGVCASFNHGPFTLDYGPHKFYTTISGVYDKFFKIVEGEHLKIKKKNSLRLLGKNFDFPVKMVQLLTGINPWIGFKCGSGVIYQLGKGVFKKKEPQNYEEYFIKGFGQTGYSLLFRDYAWKIWGDPKKLSTELARKRVPVSGLIGLLKSILFNKNDKKISADYFYYPKKGFGTITKNLANNIREKGNKIHLESTLSKIEVKNNKVTAVEIEKLGERKIVNVDFLVSSIPLLNLVNILSPKPPQKVLDEVKKLKYRSVILFYIVTNKEKPLKDNWVFYPEKEFIFNRISDHKSFSPHTCPPGKRVLTIEITCNEGDEIHQANDQVLFDKVIPSLKKLGIVDEKNVEEYFTKRLNGVYPIYSLEYKENLSVVLGYLSSIDNLYTIGRMGLFNYNNADHCIDMGTLTANHILESEDNAKWEKLLKHFNSYRIVD
jgi:protoporphyrinogen oxidase